MVHNPDVFVASSSLTGAMHHVDNRLLLVLHALWRSGLVIVLLVESCFQRFVNHAIHGAVALGLGIEILLDVGILVGPITIHDGVVVEDIQRAQVIAAQQQDLATHLTHRDVGTPIINEQSLVLRQVQHIAEQGV